MKVLSISSDRKIFEENSSVFARQLDYASKMEELHVVVFTLKSSGLKEKTFGNLHIYPTNSFSRWLYVFKAIKIGKKIVSSNNFTLGKDVITCQDPFESGFVGWRISKRSNIPFQLQIHTDFLSPYFQTSLLQKFRVRLSKFLLPKANGVRVVSKRIFDSIKKTNIKLKNEPKILPIAIDKEIYLNSTFEIPDNSNLKKLFPQYKFIILMASRITAEKRISVALEVFAKILEKNKDIGLCIAGEGPLKSDLQKQCDNLGISKNVNFLGWRNDFPLLLKTADMFLNTSEFEGFGVSLMEAGLSECPVLTTNVGIASDFLIHNKNSYICEVSDTLCMFDGIIKIINDEVFRKEISEKLMDDLKGFIPTKGEYLSRYIDLLGQSSKI